MLVAREFGYCYGWVSYTSLNVGEDETQRKAILFDDDMIWPIYDNLILFTFGERQEGSNRIRENILLFIPTPLFWGR